MKTLHLSSRDLRAFQFVIAGLAIGALFLPWISHQTTIMDGHIWTSDPGHASPFGRCLAGFLAGSAIVSALETVLNRRAAFIHAGFFAATLLVAVIVHLLPSTPGLGEPKVGFGIQLYLLAATVFFAVTWMLSPQNKA
jgi:hypothetical protein